MSPFTKACCEAALEIITLLKNTEHSTGTECTQVGAGGDVSLVYDLIAERCFVKHLSTFGEIHSEEGGYIGEGEDLIILDPIDGSDNLISNFPYYGASVALQHAGHTTVGFVCNFSNGEYFVREKGQLYRGFLTQDNVLEVEINPFSKIGLFEKASQHPDIAIKLMDAKLKFRAPGAVALSLAYAHEVKYMIFIGKARSYDVAAGLYLCEDLHQYVDDECIIVSHNKDIFAKILRIFNLSDKQR